MACVGDQECGILGKLMFFFGACTGRVVWGSAVCPGSGGQEGQGGPTEHHNHRGHPDQRAQWQCARCVFDHSSPDANWEEDYKGEVIHLVFGLAARWGAWTLAYREEILVSRVAAAVVRVR